MPIGRPSVAIMADHLGEGDDEVRDGMGWHLSEKRQGDVQTFRSDPTDVPTSVDRAQRRNGSLGAGQCVLGKRHCDEEALRGRGLSGHDLCSTEVRPISFVTREMVVQVQASPGRDRAHSDAGCVPGRHRNPSRRGHALLA